MCKNFLVILICFYSLTVSLNAQNQGDQLFLQRCKVCHTIGDGKLIGPDLANIQNRRTKEWIIKFVQSSQSLIKSGDSVAVAVFNQHNKVVMPDQDLNANQIKSIIEFIAINSPDANNPSQKTPAQIFSPALVTNLDIERGRKIFDGTSRLTNNGPSCISCHNVNYAGMFNGGLLAIYLTGAFTRLGAAGIDGILRNPPFPSMVNGFGSSPLTDEEVKSLLAFLYETNKKSALQFSSLQLQFTLLLGIVVGLNIVLIVLLIRWHSVKKYSTNLR